MLWGQTVSLRRALLPGPILVRTMVATWLATALAPNPAIAEDKPGETERVQRQASSGFTLKVPVEVVVVNAIVTDRDGNPITDLTVDDFEVLENRKKQAIQSFSQEIYQSPQTPDKPRLLSLVIDDVTYPPTGTLNRIVQAIRGFVKRRLRANNYISIMTASGGYFVPFTQDRELLLTEIDQLHKKLDSSRPARLLGGPQSRIRRLLDALRAHIRSLGPVEAQKSLVLFSGGFLHLGLHYDLERLVDMALKTGVILNTIQATGMETSPMYDVSEETTLFQSLTDDGSPHATKENSPRVPGQGYGRNSFQRQ